jgi:hypothetical protein
MSTFQSFCNTKWKQVSSGCIITITKKELQNLLLRYDHFFYYDGTPWKLKAIHKGVGVYVVERVPYTPGEKEQE